MKKRFLLVSALLAGLIIGQAQDSQPKGNSRITGIVIDSTDNVAVQFATIALLDIKTTKPIDGTVADEHGKFSLSKVPAGEFDVVISFVGYETKTFRVKPTEKRDEINLGVIKLSFEAAFLNDVVVEGQRAIIEEKVDRTVYNAEHDKTTAGGDASDVLRRVPMLSVDLDGNVSMRGNSNVRVLINNKPSTIMASSVADAMKQIPADMIKSVEVITSPSARYDAEGSAGIINIITKKNTLQGLTFNIDAGAGLRGSNLGLNGNYRKGKMGFSLGGFGRGGYNVRGSFDNTQERTAYDINGAPLSMSTNVQTANTLRRDLFGRYQFGWDYEINKSSNLAASVRYGTRNGWNSQDDLRTLVSSTNFETGAVRNTETLAQVDSKDLSGNVDVNLDYTRTFASPQREFSFLTMYGRNNRTNNFESLTDSLNSSPISGRRNNNPSYNQEITFQADYQTPIGDKQLVEVGGKNITRTVSSEYVSYNLVNGNYEPLGSSVNLSNNFNYNQNVTAGYLSYTYNSKSKYSFKVGGRYEYTTINANFASRTDDSDEVAEIKPYGAFVPSINVSRKLSAGNTLKAAYNRRIQRPSIQFLNPNIQSANPLIVTQGNPTLEPEYTDNYELSYNLFIKGTTLNFAGFYRNTTGAIQSVRASKGDTLFTTYQNIGTEQAYGLNFFGNVSISKKLSLNGGVDSYYAVLNNNKAGLENAQNTGWVFNGRIFGNYSLKNGWGLQLHSFFRGRNVSLQGYQGGFRMYGLSIRKELKDKKGSIGLGAENFATSSLIVRNVINSTTLNGTNEGYTLLNQNSKNVMYNMNLRVTFSYRIGKMSFESNNNRRSGGRRSVNNDDLKQGGDDNNNGGGGMDQMQSGGGTQQRAGQQINGRPGAKPGATAPEKTPEEKKRTEKKKKKN